MIARETTIWKAGAVATDDTRSSESGAPEAPDGPGCGLSAQPDHILVGLVAEQNAAAFSELVTRHADRHLSLAQRVMGRRAEAEDALQDAFSKLWIHAGRFDADRAKFSTWFYRIVLNQCLDLKRKKQPHALPEGFDIVDERDGPDRQLLEGQRARAVRLALSALPDRQQVAITLCYFEGITNRDAADILEINIKALESLLSRGRKQLAKLLTGEIKELLGPD